MDGWMWSWSVVGMGDGQVAKSGEMWREKEKERFERADKTCKNSKGDRRGGGQRGITTERAVAGLGSAGWLAMAGWLAGEREQRGHKAATVGVPNTTCIQGRGAVANGTTPKAAAAISVCVSHTHTRHFGRGQEAPLGTETAAWVKFYPARPRSNRPPPPLVNASWAAERRATAYTQPPPGHPRAPRAPHIPHFAYRQQKEDTEDTEAIPKYTLDAHDSTHTPPFSRT